MALHLIKLSVGVDSVEHLADIQAARMQDRANQGLTPTLMHITRMWPKRRDALLEGGSIYWVIKRVIRCRQRLTALEETLNDRGLPACGLVLDPEIVPVVPRSFRAFQGWRYLKDDDAPADLSYAGRAAADLPTELADELRGLGLI